jgi:hypothetical protein
MGETGDVLDDSIETDDEAAFVWLQAAVQEVLGTGLPEVLAETATLTVHPPCPA